MEKTFTANQISDKGWISKIHRKFMTSSVIKTKQNEM